ncbi:hypothetical protein [Burkholderia multivorans]|uniref:hypothetical protein n=1 Tax=Burkholderia multivorans TaxID=87883 RepID=UPI0011B4EB7A|nr:hypothetical protein [Burkholderia multivorans]HEM8493981.1 hypothetical protein [Burkholderia multivorans]
MKVDQSEEKSVQHNALAELIEQFLPKHLNSGGQLGKPKAREPSSPIKVVPWHDRPAANAPIMRPPDARSTLAHALRRLVTKTAQNLLALSEFFAKFFSLSSLVRTVGEPLFTWLSGLFLFIESRCQFEHPPTERYHVTFLW